MAIGDRTTGQKLADSIFSGTPYNIFTSDEGLKIKYLKEMHQSFEQHRTSVEQSLHKLSRGGGLSVVQRMPDYMPPPEILINTDSLANSHREVTDKLGDVLEAQRDLFEVAHGIHTPLLQRMVRNQGISNLQLQEGNAINLQAAIGAFQQRNTQINQLTEIIATGQGIIAEVSNVGMTIEYQAEATRDLLHQLFTDMGTQITEMTNEQVITRMSVLQALYRVRTTYIQSHEQVMLSHQKQIGLLAQILEAVCMTEREKGSRYEWKRAEKVRQKATSQEDFDRALKILQDAHELDELNPSVYLSAGTIHSSLGHPDIAAVAFAQADFMLDDSPHITSYTLMNLASNLLLLTMPEYAERVMRKATRIDPHNREAWFLYAKTAWKAGKADVAIQVMKTLLSLNSAYYKAQLLVDHEFTELASFLFDTRQ